MSSLFDRGVEVGHRAPHVARALIAAVLVAWVSLLGACAAPVLPPSSSGVSAGGHTEHEHAAPAWTLEQLASGAKLLQQLGTVRRAVTTESREAQAYFDQGLALTYGFNHDEAARSFAKAGAIDPACALCFWGVAYTLGPNYNMPLLPERAQAAWDALGRAQAQAAHASPVEQALIGALSQRYKGPQYLDPPQMQPYLEAYAAAMRGVVEQFPQDDDVQALFAEALMNVAPWKLWSASGEPAPVTLDAVKALETVLARSPEHVGANHYYIHAVEASKTPDRALVAARRLGGLVPGAGHLVHMPAHIFQRVGLYAEASEANRRAVVADTRYLEQTTPPGYYPVYVGHNYGFLAYSAAMEGRSEEALEAARKSASSVPRDLVCGMPGMDFFLSEPLLVMVRFGRWAEILAVPEPEPKYPVLRALYHHAQGMALAATGRAAEAAERAVKIRALAQGLSPELMAGLNQGLQVLELAAVVVEARVAEVTKSPGAIGLWQRAVTLEDALGYNEPADWFYPTRHYLGAALLDAGRAQDAEAVFRADLERHPRNGWATFGLWKALELGRQPKAAAAARAEFATAFARADIQLQRSAF
jgi:tetratricopeptide (TPR) repeat protein